MWGEWNYSRRCYKYKQVSVILLLSPYQSFCYVALYKSAHPKLISVLCTHESLSNLSCVPVTSLCICSPRWAVSIGGVTELVNSQFIDSSVHLPPVSAVCTSVHCSSPASALTCPGSRPAPSLPPSAVLYCSLWIKQKERKPTLFS